MNFSNNDKLLKGMAFEKAILEILKKDNPDLNENVVEKDKDLIVEYDAVLYNKIDLKSFCLETIFGRRILIEIKAGRQSKEYINRFIQRFNKKFDLIVFFLAGQKPRNLEIIQNENCRIVYIDYYDLIKNEDIKEILNNFDNYILRDENILLKDNYKLLYSNGYNLSFALGAGCSINSNISDWNVLSEALGFELLYNVVSENDSIYKKMSITNELNKKIFDCYEKTSALDAIYNSYISSSSVTKLDYFDSIKKILYMSYDNPHDSNTPLLTAINKCIERNNIQEIITYNFDSVLEQNYDNLYRSNSKEIFDSETHIGNCIVNHVHGYIPYDYNARVPVNNFIFIDKEYYDNMLDPNTFCNKKQREVLRKYNVIFVGVSFTDENMKSLLRERKTNGYTNLVFGFLKLPKFEGKDKDVLIMIRKYKFIQETYYNSLGVKILWVNDYSEIPNCIDRI